MSVSTFRPIACLIAWSILVSCSEDSTAPPPAVESNVTLESKNAVTQDIGLEGGTLEATANDGTVYTLEIPEGSIPGEQTITMTPIVHIDGYPLAGGAAAGVALKPSGLVFTVPAILQIETTRTPGAGTTPVAITFEGDATSFAPGFIASGAGVFTIPLEHFSGGTFGFATAQELATIIGNSGGATCLFNAFAPATAGDMPAAIAVYRSCFVSDVLPTLVQAGTDRELARAIGQYEMWKTCSRLALGIPPFDDASETQQAMDALVLKLQQAITRNNDLCKQNESFVSAANVLFWQKQAARFGVDTVAHLLDLETVVRDLCLRVVVDNVQIPANMQVGFPHSLDIEFGVIFDGQTASQGAPFSVQIAGSGVTIQHPTGFTNSQGLYTTVVTATQAGPISLTATACLVFPGTTLPTPVCVDRVITGTGGPVGVDLTGRWRFSFFSPDAPSHCGQFGGIAIADLQQNQNAVTGTWESTGMCGHTTMSGTMTATVANGTDGASTWVELDNWRIGFTSAPDICLTSMAEMVVQHAVRMNFDASSTNETGVPAVGHSSEPGCPDTMNFLLGIMFRCPTATCQ